MAKSRASVRPSSIVRPKNRLLRTLPEPDFQRLVPDLKTVSTGARRVFHKQGEPVRHVYFPNGGVASVTTMLADGMMIENATIGLEGMIGIEAFLARDAVSPGHTMMQVPDTDAEQLSVGAFRREIERHGALADLIGRYVEATVAQMMQSAACNARHQVQERCARWLLMTHDRIGTDEFRLSQEFLAMMLGVRRQSVTAVAGALQAARLLSYKHGRINILNRQGLEAASCECYAVIRRRFDALLRIVR